MTGSSDSLRSLTGVLGGGGDLPRIRILAVSTAPSFTSFFDFASTYFISLRLALLGIIRPVFGPLFPILNSSKSSLLAATSTGVRPLLLRASK